MSKTTREKLQESVESWQQSADSERSQVTKSLAIFGGGAALIGVGVIGFVAGAPEGLVALIPGGVMTWIGQDSLRSDVANAMEMQGKVAVAQYRLEEFEKS